ncbi:MAG: hypothetical protein MUE46_17030 [Xanthomonadales bacterium]|nr:hypothetical protein [Xanthomonadales bacterium]
MKQDCDCGPRGSGRERSDRPEPPDWEPLPGAERHYANHLVRCTRCARRFAVHALASGGIYGDYDWREVRD